MIKKISIVDILLAWGRKTPGIRASKQAAVRGVVAFHTGKGYGRRVGKWIASIDENLNFWGPDEFGESSGLSLGPDGRQRPMPPWLQPADPEFFKKVSEVLFRFKKTGGDSGGGGSSGDL